MGYLTERVCLASAHTEIVIRTHMSGRSLINLWVLGMAMFDASDLNRHYSGQISSALWDASESRAKCEIGIREGQKKC